MGMFASLLQRIGVVGSQTALSGNNRAYDAARNDTREMVGWYPPKTAGLDENLSTRDEVIARTRDLVRNHPIISGGVDRRAEAVVGANLRLETQPAFELMGQDADWADEWSAQTEQAFELWSRDPRNLCDAQMHLQFGGMVEMAYRHWWNDGEAAAIPKMLAPIGPRVMAEYRTCIEVIDPDRISNPRGLPDGHVLANGHKLIGGMEYDRNGARIAAYVRKVHPQALNLAANDHFTWTRIPFFGPTGTPRFIHAMKRDRADQRRGISRIVSALKRTKMFDRYDDAEVEAALLNSVMAAWIESPYETGDVAAALAPGSEMQGSDDYNMQALMQYRMDHPVRLEGVRTIHGAPGEKLTLNRAEHPSQNYPEFQATGLRTIAAKFGLSYAQLSANWADINYSSARAMLNEVWRGLLHDRWLFTQAFCTPIYLAWLEEAIALGKVSIPGRKTNFYRWRNALSLCEWVGPGRGSVDPLKEAQANDFELNQGATDLQSMSNERGRDYRKTLMAQHRVDKYREKLGMGPFVPLKGGGSGAGGDDAGSESKVDSGDAEQQNSDSRRRSDGKFAPGEQEEETA